LEEKDMSNLMHLFKVNQKVKCNVDGKFFNGTVKETYEDHIIIDVPEISDHMWYEEGLNIGDVYHMEKIDNNIQLAFLGGIKVGLEALIHGLEVVAKNNNGQVSFEFVKMVSASTIADVELKLSSIENGKGLIDVLNNKSK
jgi:hypothetical protein